MAQSRFLCRWDEIPENSGRGFTLDTDDGPVDLFVIRKCDRLYGYINRCPHTGVNLDWIPDQFLDTSGELIQCATHGALFRITDGYCTYGPCAGDSLSAIELRLEDGEILITTPIAPPSCDGRSGG